MAKFKQNFFSQQQTNVSLIQRKNGTGYSVRENRNRFFFPDEWQAFYDALTKKQRITFNFLINTGARINEIRHVKIGDVDEGRNSIILKWTKSRNKDGTPRMRIIPVSSRFIKWLKAIEKEYNLKSNDHFPILSTPAANIALKKTLWNIGIADYYAFSVHNVRKTLETWLIAIDIDSMKVSKHFGHSIAVASKFYVSPDTFNFQDKKMIREVIGDLYIPQRF